MAKLNWNKPRKLHSSQIIQEIDKESVKKQHKQALSLHYKAKTRGNKPWPWEVGPIVNPRLKRLE
jgi:hypothetical protein